MKEYHAVIWPQHGIFGTGTTIDEAFGLIETIEKAAQVYMLVAGHEIRQRITDEQLTRTGTTVWCYSSSRHIERSMVKNESLYVAQRQMQGNYIILLINA